MEKNRRNKVTPVFKFPHASVRSKTVPNSPNQHEQQRVEKISKVSHRLRSQVKTTMRNQKSAKKASNIHRKTISAEQLTLPRHSARIPQEVLEYPPLACLPFPFSSRPSMTPRFVSSLLQLWRLSALPKIGLTCTLSDSIVLAYGLGEE